MEALTLTVLFENEFSLVIIVIVLSPPSVLSSLSLILRHSGRYDGGTKKKQYGWERVERVRCVARGRKEGPGSEAYLRAWTAARGRCFLGLTKTVKIL